MSWGPVGNGPGQQGQPLNSGTPLRPGALSLRALGLCRRWGWAPAVEPDWEGGQAHSRAPRAEPWASSAEPAQTQEIA